MDIKKLPPSLLVALGLVGCGPKVNPPDDSAGDASNSQGSSAEASTSACLDVAPQTESDSTSGPCLGMEPTTVGPCLKYDLGGGYGSSSGSGSDSGATTSGGSGSDSGDTTTTGPCLAPPGVAPDDGEGPQSPGQSASARAEIRQRLRAAGILPPDVADKLEA